MTDSRVLGQVLMHTEPVMRTVLFSLFASPPWTAIQTRCWSGWPCLVSTKVSAHFMFVESRVVLLAFTGDMQIVALEQLCMLLLLSDNVDRVFEKYSSYQLYK